MLFEFRVLPAKAPGTLLVAFGKNKVIVPGPDLIVGVVSRTAMKQPPWCNYPSRFEKALLQGSTA
ncbi:MAG: hypothetical protein ABW185_26245 [Sedimenticola sp.]